MKNAKQLCRKFNGLDYECTNIFDSEHKAKQFVKELRTKNNLFRIIPIENGKNYAIFNHFRF